MLKYLRTNEYLMVWVCIFLPCSLAILNFFISNTEIKTWLGVSGGVGIGLYMFYVILEKIEEKKYLSQRLQRDSRIEKKIIQ